MAEKTGERISLHLLDGFAAETSGYGRLAIKNRKACGLLAYLALRPNGCETRERLAGLLWSDRSEDQARASLRQCLKQLRGLFETVGSHALQTERQEVAVESSGIKVDLADIWHRLEESDIDPALTEGRFAPERILYGLEDLDPAYAAWLHVTRRQWQDKLAERLEKRLRDRALPVEDRKKAAQALVAIDATHEEAHRFLIKQFAGEGSTAGALRQYNQLWELLGEEYDMEPAEETQALIAEVKSGSFPLPSAPAALLPEQIAKPFETPPAIEEVHFPILGVGQFFPAARMDIENYFVEGFRRDLIASLVRFRDWIVIDGGGKPANGESDKMVGEGLARGVDYQIEGTYFDHKGSIDLVLTLKDLVTRQYIWSERYVLLLDNWSGAQRQIVMRMSAALSIHISAQQVAQHITTPEIAADVYNLWLKGYHLIWSWDPEVRQEAEVIFRQVIERCPTFAPAHSGLASIFSSKHMISPGIFPDQPLLEEAARLAQTSVALDPLDVRGQVALAWANGMIGRFDQAELHHRLAYDLNPNNPTTLFSCANGLSMCGDLESARRISDEAIQLMPVVRPGQWAYLASTHFICGDYEGSVKAAELAQDVIPMSPGWRVAALGQLGWQDRAEAAAAHFLAFMRKKWIGKQPYSDALAVEWFLQHCPLRQSDPLERAREGLAKAGLPV